MEHEIPAQGQGQGFAAAQIAAALGVSARAVRKRLAGVVPSGCMTVQGGESKAWALEALPEDVRQELEGAARHRGYRNALSLLGSEEKLWAPAIPWAELKSECREAAERLQRALVLPLAKRSDLPAAELTALGLREYRLAFDGREISGDHWNRLLRRTLERDGGLERFDRPELYLADVLARKPEARPEVLRLAVEHEALKAHVENLANQAAPTVEDRAYFLHQVCLHWERIEAAHPDPVEREAAKAAMVTWLTANVPNLSRSEAGMRKLWRRSWAKWLANGKTPEAVADKRGRDSGWFRQPDFKADFAKVAARAVQHGGSESLAYRQLWKEGAFSKEFTDYYTFNLRHDKSRVPRTLREAITPLVDALAPVHRGPWQAKAAGPYITRDWTGVHAGDWTVCDDVTLPVYAWYSDDHGRPQITRGECLVALDLRSLYPLGFVLAPPPYNARWIRRLLRLVHDSVGLPRKGLYLEGGVWKARMIDGDRKATLPWRETQVGIEAHGLFMGEPEAGLRDKGIGLEIKHALPHNARSKPIEGVFHILQDSMRSEPGFIGFNERIEKFEAMQETIRQVRTGAVHPRDAGLLHMSEWTARIQSHLEAYAKEPQNGRMLDGMSPAAMWRAGTENRPLRQLPEELSYVLDTHKKPVTVGPRGIVLQVGKEKLCYANERLAGMIGQNCLAFFHVDFPDLLHVTDMNRRNAFTVRAARLPAMSATPEQHEAVNRDLAGFRRGMRTEYGRVKHEFVNVVSRDGEGGEQLTELGETISRNVAAEREATTAATRTQARQKARAQELGLRLPSNPDNWDRAIRGRERELERRQRMRRQRDADQAPAETGPIEL